MNPTQDYKQLLTQVIKKQIVILGPDITLAKARNVPGLVVADDGTVTDISGDQQQITQKLVDQFVQLSGEIVKKTMEPLLAISQAPITPAPTVTPAPAATPVQQNISPVTPTPPTPPLPTPQPSQPMESTTPIAQTPVAQDTTPVQS